MYNYDVAGMKIEGKILIKIFTMSEEEELHSGSQTPFMLHRCNLFSEIAVHRLLLLLTHFDQELV